MKAKIDNELLNLNLQLHFEFLQPNSTVFFYAFRFNFELSAKLSQNKMKMGKFWLFRIYFTKFRVFRIFASIANTFLLWVSVNPIENWVSARFQCEFGILVLVFFKVDAYLFAFLVFYCFSAIFARVFPEFSEHITQGSIKISEHNCNLILFTKRTCIFIYTYWCSH